MCEQGLQFLVSPPDYKITEASYTQFAKHIHRMLSSTTIKVLGADNVMHDSTQPTDNLYNTILQSCLYDGLHWRHAVAARIISAALATFSMRYRMTKSHLSTCRLAVQK